MKWDWQRWDGLWQLVLIVTIFGLFSSLSSVLFATHWNAHTHRLLGALGMALLVYGVYLSPVTPRWRIGLSLSLCCVLLLVEIAQFCCYWATGDQISVEVLCNANLTNLTMGILLYPWKTVGGVGLLLGLVGGFYFLFRRPPPLALPPRFWLILILLGTLGTVALSSLAELGRLYADAVRLVKIRHFNPDFYRACGIKLCGVTREQVAATPGKNLVFIYLEGFEQAYLDETYFPGVAPQLRALRREALNFDAVTNAWNASLSFGGMYASFTGSVLTPRHLPNELNSGVNLTIGAQMSSFPWILHRAGYHQVFLLGPEVDFAGVNALLQREGFDEMISCGTRKNDPACWGAYDRELFEHALVKYQELTARKQPFHLMLFTIDTHAPDGFADPEPLSHLAGSEVPQLLQAVHNTDAVVGHFIRRLQQLPGWENTCVVLTSDHLAPPNALQERLCRVPRRHHLNMVLQAGRTGTVTTPGRTFDIAPTVLEVLQVRHNYVFPLGESLLGTPSPERLVESRDFQDGMDSYTMMRSPLELEEFPAVEVISTPLLGVNVDGMTFPLFMEEGRQRLPGENEFFMLTISPDSRRTWTEIVTDREAMLKKIGEQYTANFHILFGLSRDTASAHAPVWQLGIGKGRQWSWATGSQPQQLSVRWQP